MTTDRVAGQTVRDESQDSGGDGDEGLFGQAEEAISVKNKAEECRSATHHGCRHGRSSDGDRLELAHLLRPQVADPSTKERLVSVQLDDPDSIQHLGEQPDALVHDVELGLAGREHALDEESLDGRVENEDGDTDEGRVAHVDEQEDAADDDDDGLDPAEVDEERTPFHERGVAARQGVGKDVSLSEETQADDATHLETRVMSCPLGCATRLFPERRSDLREMLAMIEDRITAEKGKLVFGEILKHDKLTH